jgi:hypothetical protein
MRSLSCVAAILAVGMATAACEIQAGTGGFDLDFGRGKATESWQRTYQVQGDGRFELINVNGKITALPADGTALVVEARKTARAMSDDAAKQLLSSLEIDEQVSGGSVRVESRPPQVHGFSGHEIEWTVKVPKGVVLTLRTRNGGVRLNGLSNEVHAETHNGGIHGQNIDPSILTASTRNGGIDIGFTRPLEASDAVDAETVNGGVSLSMPEGSKASIESQCRNGGVHVAGLDISQVESMSRKERRRRLSGTLNGGGARVRLTTRNGGIHLSRSN